MALTVRGQFSDFFLETMKPMLELIITQYGKRYPAQWPRVFRQDSTRASIYQASGITGVGLPTLITEGAPVRFDSPLQAFDKTFKPLRYGLGIQISKDAAEDDTKLKLVSKQAGMLSNSIKEAQEIQAASIFNNGFSDTGPDGVSLFSASHPLVKVGGVQSNILSAAADFDNDSFALALTDYETMLTHEGHHMSLPVPTLWVAPQNRFNAAEVIESVDRSDTGNRATNPLKYSKDGMPDWKVWQYLSDPDSWYLCASPEETDLLVIWRDKPYTKSWYDDPTETGNTAQRYKWDVGYASYYGTYGTPGA